MLSSFPVLNNKRSLQNEETKQSPHILQFLHSLLPNHLLPSTDANFPFKKPVIIFSSAVTLQTFGWLLSGNQFFFSFNLTKNDNFVVCNKKENDDNHNYKTENTPAQKQQVVD
jgi:hypothetical protein